MIEELQDAGKQGVINGVVAISGIRNPIAFLIVGGNDAINHLYDTADGDLARHIREIGGSAYRILDRNFIDAIFDSVAPICGNYYSYVMEVSLVGKLAETDPLNLEEMRLENISSASIIDHHGEVIKLDERLD